MTTVTLSATASARERPAPREPADRLDPVRRRSWGVEGGKGLWGQVGGGHGRGRAADAEVDGEVDLGLGGDRGGGALVVGGHAAAADHRDRAEADADLVGVELDGGRAEGVEH